MYTVGQIDRAVEGFENGLYDDLDESQYSKNVESLTGHSYLQYPPEGWSEVQYSSFLFIDGKMVDYETVETSGGMDKGSLASVTIRIGDQYFRKSGYYASHYGYDWDGPLDEVFPREKIVTVYETK